MNDNTRIKIIQDVISRNLRPGQAAEILNVTPRHLSRLLKRYRLNPAPGDALCWYMWMTPRAINAFTFRALRINIHLL